MTLLPLGHLLDTLLSFIFDAAIFAGFRCIDRTGSTSFNDLFSWTPRGGALLGANTLASTLALLVVAPFLAIIYRLYGWEQLNYIIAEQTGVFWHLMDFDLSFALLMVIFGAIALFLTTMISFALLFIVQFRGMRLMAALKLSWRIGTANAGALIVFLCISLGLFLLGFVCLVIGLLVTIPLMNGMQYYLLSSVLPHEQPLQEWDFMKPVDL